MNQIWNNFKLFLWLTLVTGIIYPLLITGIAQLTMKKKADGDFISYNGKIIGAKLISQKFESKKYFWPRPSAVEYNPLPSGGSNLGSTSAALKKVINDRKQKILQTNNNVSNDIPSELLYASGSGLDPHISPATAHFQIDRIIKARGLDNKTGKQELKDLIDRMTLQRRFGFLGQPCLNVLMLNKALDELSHE